MDSFKIYIVNIIKIICHIVLVLSYVVGLFPTAYYFPIIGFPAFFVAIPLIIVITYFSYRDKVYTLNYDAINLIMSFLAFIPIFGWFALLSGIALSVLSIIILFNDTLKRYTVKEVFKESSQNKFSYSESEVIEVQPFKVDKKS
jgi:hypothetical protein